MVRVMARLRKRSLSDQSSRRLCILPAQFGDEVEALGDQQLLGQGLRKIAFGAFEFAD